MEKNFTEILYSTEGGHELFEEYIKELLNNYLKNNAVLIAQDGTISKAEELIMMRLSRQGLRIQLTDNIW